MAEKKSGLSLSDQDEIAEILQDFAAISKVDAALGAQQQADMDEPDASEQGEAGENEEDLMQLAEYVRVAALNVYAQCIELNAPGAPTDSGSLTLH